MHAVIVSVTINDGERRLSPWSGSAAHQRALASSLAAGSGPIGTRAEAR